MKKESVSTIKSKAATRLFSVIVYVSENKAQIGRSLERNSEMLIQQAVVGQLRSDEHLVNSIKMYLAIDRAKKAVDMTYVS